ncbi:MAG TPA: preprotein translocase subunit YajC [Propionibacteriaceae bacterium]|nr:preprotein translocase subunit YajC [Propionibacteriaceae bacterium]
MIPLLSSTQSTILMVAMMAALFYFMIQRPMKRRAAEAAKMADSLEPGTRVLLSGGYLGTVLHIGQKQAIVELAPGVEVTVLRAAILKPMSPADEEFEYDDDAVMDDSVDGDAAILVDQSAEFSSILDREPALIQGDESEVLDAEPPVSHDPSAQRDGNATN